MERVPRHMLSRVISIDWFGSIGLLPVGLRPLGAAVGPGRAQAMIAAGIGRLLCLFRSLADRRIRDLD